MNDMPEKVRVQDAVLANMVTLTAILEYLDSLNPGAKAMIDQRAVELARMMKRELNAPQPSEGD